MTVKGEDFTRAAYRALLQALLDRGYAGRAFPDAVPSEAHLLLRHDIDLWPRAALAQSEIERDLGLSADYFFLVDCPLYDIDAPETVAVFKALLRDGHRIGLHFDAVRHPDDLDALNREAAAECLRLERATGAPVALVSFHRPAKSLLGLADPIAGRPHAYQPCFFRDIGYSSDSRGLWRHGHPLDHPAVKAGTALQLLTHPVWWATDCGGDRQAALAHVVAELGEQAKPVIAETVTGYDAATGRIIE